MGDHQSANLAGADPRDELPQAPLLVVEFRSDVFDDLVGPAVRRRERLQQCDLAHEIILLARSSNSGIKQRHTV